MSDTQKYAGEKRKIEQAMIRMENAQMHIDVMRSVTGNQEFDPFFKRIMREYVIDSMHQLQVQTELSTEAKSRTNDGENLAKLMMFLAREDPPEPTQTGNKSPVAHGTRKKKNAIKHV